MKTFIKYIAGCLILAPGVAFAEQVCMPTDELKAALIDWYGEAPVDAYFGPGIQMWASEETGTWTLVAFDSPGMSCTLESGTGYTPDQADEDLIALATE